MRTWLTACFFRCSAYTCAVMVIFLTVTPALASSLEEKATEAAGFIEKKDYEQAYSVYMDLMREYPNEPQVNLGLARTARLANHYNHALMAYERLLSAAPDDAGLHLELAQLMLTMGDTEGAKREIAEVKRLNPAAAEGDLDLIIKGMERQTATFLASGRVAGGALYDSNMNTAPSQRSVTVGSLPITLDRTSTAKESFGSYLQATGDIAWRANASSPWWLVADVGAYQRWYEESSPARNLTFGRGALGLRYAQEKALFEVRAKAETLLENNDTSVNIVGAETSIAYAVQNTLHLMFRGAAEHRDDINTEGRSGTYLWGGPYLRWFFGSANHSVMLGAKGFTAATDENRYSYNGVEPSVVFMFNLPWETELAVQGAWQAQKYHGPATVFDNKDRSDSQWRAGVFATKKITDNLQVEAGWQYTDNHSNSDLYDYTQHLVTLGLAFTF